MTAFSVIGLPLASKHPGTIGPSLVATGAVALAAWRTALHRARNPRFSVSPIRAAICSTTALPSPTTALWSIPAISASVGSLAAGGVGAGAAAAALLAATVAGG